MKLPGVTLSLGILIMRHYQGGCRKEPPFTPGVQPWGRAPCFSVHDVRHLESSVANSSKSMEVGV